MLELMMINKKIKHTRFLQALGIYLGIAVLLFAGVLTTMQKAYAATLTDSQVLETNMNANNTSSPSAYYFAFKAGAADAAGSLTVAFPGTFTLASGTETSHIDTTACTSIFPGAIALPGSLTANDSGTTTTFSGMTLLASGTEYCAGINTGVLTNPATAQDYTTTITVDSTDTQTQAIDVITNDQITVTASISQVFTLAFSGGLADAIGSLSPSSLATSPTGVTATVTTNAPSGWGLWAEDLYNGLKSPSTTAVIPYITPGTNTNMGGGEIGTQHMALGVTTTNATAPFNDYTTAGYGGGISNTGLNEIASSTSGANAVPVTIKQLVDISAATPDATDYTDGVNVIGAGAF